MSGFTNFRIPSLTFLLEFSADQKWQTKMAVIIFLDFRQNDRTLKNTFFISDADFSMKCQIFVKMSELFKNHSFDFLENGHFVFSVMTLDFI